jgi:transcriptional regulator GlxA family with amidase domain
MTLFEYITLARISAAKKLLSESDKSISEIAAAVGFDSFAYFSKVFREKESITPSVYRKENKA